MLMTQSLNQYTAATYYRDHARRVHDVGDLAKLAALMAVFATFNYFQLFKHSFSTNY